MEQQFNQVFEKLLEKEKGKEQRTIEYQNKLINKMKNALLEPFEQQQQQESRQRTISEYQKENRQSVHMNIKKEEKENITRIEKKLGVIERSWVMYESKRHRRRGVRDNDKNRSQIQQEDKNEIEKLQVEVQSKDDEIKRLAISNGKLHLEVMRLQSAKNKENILEDSQIHELKGRMDREKEQLMEKEKHLNNQQIKVNNEYKKISLKEKQLEQTRKDLEYDKNIINQRREHLEEMQQKLNGTILQLLEQNKKQEYAQLNQFNSFEGSQLLDQFIQWTIKERKLIDQEHRFIRELKQELLSNQN